ncbi:protein phosphatase 2C domain-containing protein [Moraxella nasovis]|uniref:PP2C family protein-serine/threonine phosphatase n=1 Tax=Moraxella nasovis TaxID=2904121 RepID=UPI001F606103|nr:protein phosphatase 2C domain-containing protein [Moraxella nasovis]UNU73438.1 protein phosphatase 2C domain-containing protein [Moraxella nasovis]
MSYQIQGFTWRGGRAYQQDALLIYPKVYQHQGVISRQIITSQCCVAIADGVSTSPHSARTARTLLTLLKTAYKAHGMVDFAKLQNELNDKLAGVCDDGGSTLVCAYGDGDGLTIKHLGDSRAYHYDGQAWRCLTKDHTVFNELAKTYAVDSNQEYASFYGGLMGYFCVDNLTGDDETHLASSMSLKLKENEVLLLCSDGLCGEFDDFPPLPTNMSLKDWLIQIFTALKKRTIAELDNVSVAVVRCIHLT